MGHPTASMTIPVTELRQMVCYPSLSSISVNPSIIMELLQTEARQHCDRTRVEAA